jgi:H/ACA ribonucleoprotein complex subunit 2
MPCTLHRGMTTKHTNRQLTAPQELGAAALSKRPTSCMLILPKPVKAAAGGDAGEAKEFDEAYGEVEKKIKAAEV